MSAETYTTATTNTYVAAPATTTYTTTTAVPTTTTYTTTTAGAYPATGAYPGEQKPSAIKGNLEAITGKFQHNPEKVYHGNMMVAQSSEQKAARFEAKALEWEQKGNLAKAQKNRDKATKYRLKAANKVTAANNAPVTAAPKGAVAGGAPYVGTGVAPVYTTGTTYATTNVTGGAPVYTTGGAYTDVNAGMIPTGTRQYADGSVGTTTYVGTTGGVAASPVYTTGTTYTTTTASPAFATPFAGGVAPTGLTTKQMDRVSRFEAKALAAERDGNLTRANKNRDKANRVRAKAGVAPVGNYPLSTAVPFTNSAALGTTGLPLASVPGTVPIATTQPGFATTTTTTTSY